MRRPASLAVSALVVSALVVAACGALPACHTDEPRRTDDAGAVAPSTKPSTAPSMDAPTTPSAMDPATNAVDAGAPTAATDARAALVSVPVVSDMVDAGHVGDAAPVPAEGAAMGSSGVGRPPPIAVDPIQVTIFNRILAKAKTRDLNPGQVQELAEQLTKQKVDKTRRTAGTFWLIQFAPTTPPRGKAEQQKLIEQLKAGGDFEFVEADQIMTVK